MTRHRDECLWIVGEMMREAARRGLHKSVGLTVAARVVKAADEAGMGVREFVERIKQQGTVGRYLECSSSGLT